MNNQEPNPLADEPFDLEREPLDEPPPLDLDWGGDGSDPTRPRRAHVLAALVPSSGPYAPPLDALLTLGELSDGVLERRAAELGIGQEHAAELVRMLRDRGLATRESDDDAAWAGMHALAILSKLDLAPFAADLVPIFDTDFERPADELIDLLGQVGEPALAPLTSYLRDTSRWVWGRSRVADALAKLATHHPERRAEVIATLNAILGGDEHELLVSGVVSSLIDLKAAETLPQIREAFERGRLDETITGAWGDVLEGMGVAPEPDDPLIEESRQRFEQRHREMFPDDMRARLQTFQERSRTQRALAEQRAATERGRQGKARKEKNKRKASSASRKANRKKRR